MPNTPPQPPIPQISRIYRTTPADFEMIADAREAIQRSYRILNESRQLAASPDSRYYGRPSPSFGEPYTPDATGPPEASEIPNK